MKREDLSAAECCGIVVILPLTLRGRRWMETRLQPNELQSDLSMIAEPDYAAAVIRLAKADGLQVAGKAS